MAIEKQSYCFTTKSTVMTNDHHTDSSRFWETYLRKRDTSQFSRRFSEIGIEPDFILNIRRILSSRIPASMLRPRLHQQCSRTIFQGQRRNPQRKNIIRISSLYRKITAALAPKKEEHDGGEVKHTDLQRIEVRDNRAQTSGSNKSMVAESICPYNVGINNPKYSRIFKF